MIRLVVPDDQSALMRLIESIDLFESQAELEAVETMLVDYLNGDGEHFWLTDNTPDGRLVSVAYCAPERMTHGTWNLLLIGVHPNSQGKGLGSAMMSHVEQILISKGAHLLLVETLADFERTRAFYTHCEYEEEAHIRDFYAAGADKVIYRKALSS